MNTIADASNSAPNMVAVEPLRYGPEVYRACNRVRAFVESWMFAATGGAERLINCEGARPTESDVKALANLTCGLTVWLFTVGNHHSLNVRLLAERLVEVKLWAREIVYRQDFVWLFEGLIEEVSRHTDSANITGII